MKDDMHAIFAFNAWANARTLEAAGKLTPEQYIAEPTPGWTSVRATLVHVADATLIWAKRLRGVKVAARAAEADFPTLEDATRLFHKGQTSFVLLLPTFTPRQLASIWRYRNLEGKEYAAPLWSVLRHVVNHASYHRGQVASKLARFGVEPPSTDLIGWAVETTDTEGG